MGKICGYGHGIYIEERVAQMFVDKKIRKITIEASGGFINVVVDANEDEIDEDP